MSNQLDRISDKEFGEFCKRNSNQSSVFNSTDWLKLFGNQLEFLAQKNEDGQIQAGFYLFRDKIKGFTFYRNPPFTPHNGFVFINSGKNPAKRMSKEKKVVAAMADHFSELALKGIVTVSLPRSVQDVQPFIWNDFKVVPQYTYVHDLTKS